MTAECAHASADRLLGTTVSGRYRVERLLGEGAMGAVYLVEHTHMRKKLALKVLHPAMSALPEVLERFEREAVAAAHIEHPNVASATDFGKMEDGSLFLVMEYLEGQSLRSLIDGGPIPLGRALHIGRQIAEALGAAHALGIVHRDLKPDNVMLVCRDHDDAFVKVLDFGIAKVPVHELGTKSGPAAQNLTRMGAIYGTAQYMAPEQAIGEAVDARADLYSLGVTFYEMLTGQLPFTGDEMSVILSKQLVAPPPPMVTVAPDTPIPAAVESCVMHLLEKQREQRYPSAKELIGALDLAATASGIEVPSSAGRGSLVSVPRLPAESSEPRLVITSPRASGELPPNPRGATLVSSTSGSLKVARAIDVAKNLAARVPPRVKWGAAALAGAVGLVGILLLAFRSPGESDLRTAADAPVASAPPEVRPAPTTLTDAELETAARQGSAALETVAAKNPEDPRVRRALVMAYVAEGRRLEMVRAVRTLVKVDAAAAGDQGLVNLVAGAVDDPVASPEALLALEESLGTRGIDALIDLASRKGPSRARAQPSLTKSSVREHASPAALVLLDLRAATSCEAKRDVLSRAEEHGDARALKVLKPMAARSGCGFLGINDCFPCLRQDKALADAIAAIEARQK